MQNISKFFKSIEQVECVCVGKVKELFHGPLTKETNNNILSIGCHVMSSPISLFLNSVEFLSFYPIQYVLGTIKIKLKSKKLPSIV